MSSSNSPPRVSLLDDIVAHGERAFNPEHPAESRALEQGKFFHLVDRTGTLPLMPVLTSLVQPGHVQPWLRPHVLRALASLPLRPGGVRNTIEFVLSVHPSTARQLESAPSSAASRGPNISLEALNSASRLIASPPTDLSPERWFQGIAPQLLSLLDGQGGLEMVKASAFIIGYGILGRKEYGAPGELPLDLMAILGLIYLGSAGWNAFAEPILGHIDPTFGIEATGVTQFQGEIVDLTLRNVIVKASVVADALRRLASLLSSHPNPGLSKRLLSNLLLPLWCLTSWKSRPEEYAAPAQFLLQILLQLSDGSKLVTIAENILFRGNRAGVQCWTYNVALGGGIQIEKWTGEEDGLFSANGPDLAELDRKIDVFIETLKPSHNADGVPALFLWLSRKWLSSANRPMIAHDEDFEAKVVEAKLMQRMIHELPNRLVGESAQVLELASDVLQNAIASSENMDDDDTVAVALSLLNMVFTSTKAYAQQPARGLLTTIVNMQLDVSATARNLLMLMDFQSDEPAPNPVLDNRVEDRRTYRLALSYLTTDSPPPVTAQGIDLISGLIATQSSVLDVPALIILLASVLQNEEEYIYLRAIKTFIQLSVKHPRVVIRGLLERYLDKEEERPLDARLQFGEALLQVIERAGQMFTGPVSSEVGTGLLSLAGRRGYRLKKEAEQVKKLQASRGKIAEAEGIWEGPVPRLEEDDPLLGIVEGWEGTRGQEDVRIRASALSILGVSLETNIAGLSSLIISTAVDISVNILALEPELEKAILRRSALMLVLSLLRALDKAREERRKLGFGLARTEDVQRVLRYVAETDKDNMVRQYAMDVIEGLEAWQMRTLFQQDSPPEIQNLAGLSLLPEQADRPRIEEIE